MSPGEIAVWSVVGAGVAVGFALVPEYEHKTKRRADGRAISAMLAAYSLEPDHRLKPPPAPDVPARVGRHAAVPAVLPQAGAAAPKPRSAA